MRRQHHEADPSRRKSLIFPVSGRRFPVPGENIRCSAPQGIACNALKWLAELAQPTGEMAQKLASSLLFSQ